VSDPNEIPVPEFPYVPPDKLPPTMIADGGKTYGDGMRKLPDRIKDALLSLRWLFEAQADSNRSRREYMKKCLKLHEFMRGNQWGWWDYTTGSWRSTTSTTGGQLVSTQQGQTQALYVMNFMQPFMLSLTALLTSNRMTPRFPPDDPSKPEDIVAAQKANIVLKNHEANESMNAQAKKEVYALCTCGTFASYIRTVADGERYGWLEEPATQWQEGPAPPPGRTCPICGDNLNPPEATNCEACGAPLPQATGAQSPAGPGQIQVIDPATGQPKVNRIPRAKTVRTIVDGLELKLPADAAEQADFPYLLRSREIDKSIPRATYPEIADHITGSSWSSDRGTSSEFERRIRRQASHGTTVENRPVIVDDRDRVTFTECWYRPRAFYHIDDTKVRQQLLALFPDGAYVAFANEVFCEARPEKMDDHWRVCHALPGRGQIREPIMGSLVPMQEMANDIMNIIRDVIEYTLPTTFVSTRLLDVKKWARSQVAAGATYNVMDSGRPVQEGFFQTMPGQLPQFATTFLQQLRTEIAQFLTGAFPAAYGGGTPGNSTAQGIEIERQSALGRINLFLQALREHHAEIAPLIVEDFRQNAIEPITYVDEVEGGEAQLFTVDAADFDVGKFRQTAEVVDEYPTTWAQRQALLLQMFQMPQIFGGWITMLKNINKVKDTLGSELEAPGEMAYKDQFQIIQQLLQAQPQPGPSQPVMDPNTGQPAVDPMTGQPAMQPGPPQPSVQAYPWEDNHSAFQACMDFYYSDRGRKVRENPDDPGFQNFLLHLEQLAQFLMPPPQPPPGPPGGGPATPRAGMEAAPPPPEIAAPPVAALPS
jgi:hypothetical protein